MALGAILVTLTVADASADALPYDEDGEKAIDGAAVFLDLERHPDWVLIGYPSPCAYDGGDDQAVIRDYVVIEPGTRLEGASWHSPNATDCGVLALPRAEFQVKKGRISRLDDANDAEFSALLDREDVLSSSEAPPSYQVLDRRARKHSFLDFRRVEIDEGVLRLVPVAQIFAMRGGLLHVEWAKSARTVRDPSPLRDAVEPPAELDPSDDDQAEDTPETGDASTGSGSDTTTTSATSVAAVEAVVPTQPVVNAHPVAPQVSTSPPPEPTGIGGLVAGGLALVLGGLAGFVLGRRSR